MGRGHTDVRGVRVGFDAAWESVLLIRSSGLMFTFDNASLNHLVVKIVTLSGALADSCEDGVSSVVHGNVVDQLHDNHLVQAG